MVLRNDRQTIQAAVKTCLIRDPKAVRMGRIRNTLTADRMEISENLVDEARANPRIKVVGDAGDLSFDAEGNLSRT